MTTRRPVPALPAIVLPLSLARYADQDTIASNHPLATIRTAPVNTFPQTANFQEFP